MTLEDLLKLEQSRNNVDQVINMVLANPVIFEDLWFIFSQLKEPESRRALWAIDIITENNPFLKEHHIEFLIEMLPKFTHDGYKRHSLRMIERNKIPERLKGEIVDSCFKYLESSSEPVAVKMFSLKILSGIADEEPMICRELIDIVEIQMEDATPGFKNIGAKTIRNLQKIIAREISLQ